MFKSVAELMLLSISIEFNYIEPILLTHQPNINPISKSFQESHQKKKEILAIFMLWYRPQAPI